MHRNPHKKDAEQTKLMRAQGIFRSRYSYASLRTHPGTAHNCIYLAGEDCCAQRALIYERDDSKCQDCGKVVPWDGDLTVRGHLAHGGNTKVSRCWCPENLKLKCYVCHLLKEHGREPRWSIGVSA